MLFLLALTAAVVSVALARAFDNVAFGAVLEGLERFDAELRESARRQGKTWKLKVDTRRGELTVETEGLSDLELYARRYQLPQAFRIDEVFRQRLGASGKATARGSSHITYSPRGETPTWGLRLARETDGDSRVVLFAGLTGQAIHAGSREDAVTILKTLSGNDAR